MQDDKRIELYEHNQEAYDKLCILLKKYRKACIVHPTGTGKSFIAFKFIEDHPEMRVLWISPSVTIFNLQLSGLMNAAGSKTTTYVASRIKFLTYSAINKLTEIPDSLKRDIVIIDEFHRCGAPIWSRKVRRLLDSNEDALLIGLSATPIRYLDNQRNMADELFDGNIASEMSLLKAIDCGILNPPKYIVVWGEENDKEVAALKNAAARLNNLTKRDYIFKKIRTIQKNIARLPGVNEIFKKYLVRGGRYIIFCSTFLQIDEITPVIPTWFSGIDDSPIIHTITWKNNAEKAIRSFQNDDSDHVKLIICISRLNEGLHLNKLDGIIMLRNTISPIVFLQQVGRVLSVSGTSAPVVIDMANNYGSTINTIDATRKALVPGAEALFPKNNYRTYENLPDIPPFEVIDTAKNSRELLMHLNSILRDRWEAYYLEAKKYYKTMNHLNIPCYYMTQSGLSLGLWLQTQKRIKAGLIGGSISDERVKLLDSIGIDWDQNVYSPFFQSSVYRDFDIGVEYLRIYKENYGDTMVPLSYKYNGFELGKWVHLVRVKYKDEDSCRGNRITQRKILVDMEFIWNCYDYVWDKFYEWLKGYYTEHGDINVPKDCYVVEGMGDVYTWLFNQKRAKKAGRLSEEKINMLEAINISWDEPSVNSWEYGYNKAKEFYTRYGTLDLRRCFVRDPSFDLRTWLKRQRSRRKKLSNEQINKLNEIGMVWKDPRLPTGYYQTVFEEAKKYYETHGNIDIPLNYTTESGIMLGLWLRRQKEIYRYLPRNRVETLESYGIDWSIKNP